jgi:curved DNA-binding protein
VARVAWIVEVGDDLRTETTIDVYDAILGGETRVRGLDGTYPLTIPPGVQPGQQLRLSGRGRPREGAGRGDLIVVMYVEIPQKLGATEAAALDTLRRERQMRTPRNPW